tara:strand:- start:1426 stop:2289 length:864 start_codon:yes stop_codon:yes gene_type:complete
MSRIAFLITESFMGLYRAKLQAFISSVTISITLIVFTLTYYAYVNFIDYSFELKTRYRIDVFFNAEIGYEEGKNIFNLIMNIDGIEKGEFIDKEFASDIFETYFNTKIENILGTNPLPLGGRFDVTSENRNVKSMDDIVINIKKINGIDQATFRSGLISRLDKIIDNSFNILLLIGMSIFLLSIILVSNTIRLIIHSKRNTIETLKLLGATKMFIKVPFLIEGILQGLLGSFFSVTVLWILYSLAQYIFVPIFNPMSINILDILYANIFIGIVLGIIGSYRGFSKYI